MNPARREPLLWLQLLGLAALPLEALLLLLLLAGADPGLFPGFERLLTWALGALGPAVLFWHLPPDLWSLLLLQVPLRGRRSDQFRLSALQTALPLRLLAVSGVAGLLPLVWWADAHAGLAWAWSPLSASPRLVVLMVCLPLLALMQWQWHQLIQTLWLFTRPAALLEQTLPLTQVQAAEQRLNLGLPLLLLPPLLAAEVPSVATSKPATEPPTEPEPAELAEPAQQAEETEESQESQETEQAQPEEQPQAAEPAQPAEPTAAETVEAENLEAESVAADSVEADSEPSAAPEAFEPEPFEPEASAQEPSEPAAAASDDSSETSDSSIVTVDGGGAVTPEQHPEEHQRTDLDQQV